MRQFTRDDAVLLNELDSDPEVLRFINGGIPPSLDQTVHEILPRFMAYYDCDPRFGFWAAIERSTSRFLGWFHLRPFQEDETILELGYRLEQRAWGRGFATEGSRALIAKAFEELGAREVVATALIGNLRSRRVMERLGMAIAGEFVYAADLCPQAWGTEQRRGVEYSLLRGRHEARKPRA